MEASNIGVDASAQGNQISAKVESQDFAAHSQNATLSSPINSDASVFSDSDNTNLSSANSTLRSDNSGKHGWTSQREAIATLDFFLQDVSQMTERAKQEEQKLQSVRNEATSALDKTKSQLLSSGTIDEIFKRWSSMPSVFSEEDFGESDVRSPKSFEDIRSVFSDDDPEISAHEKKRQVHARNKAQKANVSMSSQGGEVNNPSTYGLTHLNHLCKFLEQFEHLQQQNSELSKRVTNLEYNFSKQPLTDHQSSSKENLSTSPKSSALFAPPKDRPKKSKPTKIKVSNPKQHPKEKIKGTTKYLASLPFVLAAKSVDNLKFSSSQNLEKSKAKSKPKKVHNYAVDDIEIGKTLHLVEEWRRNSSVKSPSSKDADTLFSDFEKIDDKETEDKVDSPKKETKTEEMITPTIAIHEDTQPPSNIEDTTIQANPEPNPTGIKKVFPLKTSLVPRSKSEERNYRNTKKMTEWGTLQQAFPVPQIESNIDLLNNLESIVSVHKAPAKKSGHHLGFNKRHGRQKKDKHASLNNMFLPPTEVPGFASTFLAAHAMANQLTLALNLSDLESLSVPEADKTQPSQTFTNRPIPIP